MLQYEVLFVAILGIIVLVAILNVIASFNRYRAKKKVHPDLNNIRDEFFQEIELEIFEKYWPIFLDALQVRDCSYSINDKVKCLEKFFPLQDLLYENIEELLPDAGFKDEIQEMTIKELFYLFLRDKGINIAI